MSIYALKFSNYKNINGVNLIAIDNYKTNKLLLYLNSITFYKLLNKYEKIWKHKLEGINNNELKLIHNGKDNAKYNFKSVTKSIEWNFLFNTANLFEIVYPFFNYTDNNFKIIANNFLQLSYKIYYNSCIFNQGCLINNSYLKLAPIINQTVTLFEQDIAWFHNTSSIYTGDFNIFKPDMQENISNIYINQGIYFVHINLTVKNTQTSQFKHKISVFVNDYILGNNLMYKTQTKPDEDYNDFWYFKLCGLMFVPVFTILNVTRIANIQVSNCTIGWYDDFIEIVKLRSVVVD